MVRIFRRNPLFANRIGLSREVKSPGGGPDAAAEKLDGCLELRGSTWYVCPAMKISNGGSIAHIKIIHANEVPMDFL